MVSTMGGSFFHSLFEVSFLLTPIMAATLDINELEINKLYVYQPDKKTIAYIFDSVELAARELTPERCCHLSDSEIRERKNIRYIRRVINKGTLTNTEKGKFYLYQNPNYSSCLSLVP